MTEISEQRPLYGIGTVARLAGIKPDTLRVWERRYALGASHKSDKGRRLYTQTDLEHLQIVAKLLQRGFRIGEIAGMDRKTLAAMLDQSGGKGGVDKLPTSPSALFIGRGLCNWLDAHPGCLSGLDSVLSRCGLEEFVNEHEAAARSPQLLLVEVAALGAEQVELIVELHSRLDVSSALVLYEFASRHSLATLADAGLELLQLPLKTESFARGIRKMVKQLEVRRGAADAGELVSPQPRLFADAELQKVLDKPALLGCDCTHHLSAIIQSLANFEEYSSQCAVESWSDAATHTCVYAYTNQARWLMEKALAAVLEEHASDDRRSSGAA